MMRSLWIPAKTFLLGEYAVLKQFPALAVATAPNFLVQIKQQQHVNTPFHPASPAGRLGAMAHAINLTNSTGLGGLGQSSAEFIAAWLAKNNTWPDDLTQLAPLLLEDFRSVFANSTTQPSGMDVMTQLYGQLTVFDGTHYRALAWPFTNLSISLWHTGHKLATHNHLATSPTIPDKLGQISQQALAAIHSNNANHFIQLIQDYRQALVTNNLEAATTTKLIQLMAQQPEILACKGCGAMGSDVLLVLTKPEHQAKTINFCNKLPLKLLFVGQHLAAGTHQLTL